MMGKLNAYLFTTLNGYFESPKGNISWHMHAEEENEYAAENAQSGNTLLFGRITYQMMASFWPTPEAFKNSPALAEGMNKSDKIVFSRTLQRVDWNNTRLIRDNIFEEIRKLKQDPSINMTILGSDSIVTQFAEHGLLDSLQIMIDPVLLGIGTPTFQGLKDKLNLKLTASRVFKNGIVLLDYESLY
jgi:dihydrofolate reductase